MNTGHSEDNSNDESLAIQTPAVDFILLNHTVSNSHMKSLSMCTCIIKGSSILYIFIPLDKRYIISNHCFVYTLLMLCEINSCFS